VLLLCGIGQNLRYAMIASSINHALEDRSNGPHLRKNVVWLHIYEKYQGVLGLLMAL
jgi:hypothetical protein